MYGDYYNLHITLVYTFISLVILHSSLGGEPYLMGPTFAADLWVLLYEVV